LLRWRAVGTVQTADDRDDDKEDKQQNADEVIKGHDSSSGSVACAKFLRIAVSLWMF
jgi:hypothetical protein